MQPSDKFDIKIVETKDEFECLGLTNYEFETYKDFFQLYKKASQNRAHALTYLYHLSSRSHVIYQIKLYRGKDKISNITFVDLAGSENIKEHIDTSSAIDYGSLGFDCSKTRSAKKERAMEGKFINKSLFF